MSQLARSPVEISGSNHQGISDQEFCQLQPQIPHWQLNSQGGVQKLERSFLFKNFLQALDFTNRVAAIAETANHHPALLTEWGKVTVSWWSHNIQGLHKNDCIMAARTDELYQTPIEK